MIYFSANHASYIIPALEDAVMVVNTRITK